MIKTSMIKKMKNILVTNNNQSNTNGNNHDPEHYSCELITYCKNNSENNDDICMNKPIYIIDDDMEIEDTSEKYYTDLFSLMENNDFYLLNLFVKSKILTNSCFIDKYIFDNRYSCYNINKIINIINNPMLLSLIDSYLHLNHLALMQHEILPINYFTKIQQPKKNKNVYIWHKSERCDYFPCSHPGLCNSDNCQCISIRGICEKFCICKDYCEYKNNGCDCKDACFNHKSCVCVEFHRECDPDICRCTGVDFFFKSKEDYIETIENNNLCRNLGINWNCEKKTAISKSMITDTYGLFTLEDIKENELICEYKGEILSKNESDRRSVFNEYLGLNYLFQLTDSHDIDAYKIGNQMR
jgi:hypothetical protein